MDRRTFLKKTAEASGAAMVYSFFGPAVSAAVPKKTARIAFVKTTDSSAGVEHAIDLLEAGSFKSKDLFIKPNFNSSDPAPGSTHPDTLASLIRKLRKMGAGPMTIGDRSGMGKTREVMQAKGIFGLSKELNVNAIVFDELGKEQWEPIHRSGMHWEKGFLLPAPVRKAGGIISTCCLKTHRYGGHFTLSLKNSVGLAAKFSPADNYNYMNELHSSPHQRRMIAEINAAYEPDLILLDGVEAFTNGGPDNGKKVPSQVILAGTDRIAIDAVGVALLRSFGTTDEVSRGPIFQQEQIARAVELGIGVSQPSQIEFITDDPASAEYAKRIRDILNS